MPEGVAEEIDWDISVENDNEINFDYDCELGESGIEVEVEESDKNVARGSEANSVLDNPKTRDEFLAEVLEVNFLFILKNGFVLNSKKLI